MASVDDDLHDERPNGNVAKPKHDWDHACIEQVLLLQVSEDGKLRNGAINASAEKFWEKSPAKVELDVGRAG